MAQSLPNSPPIQPPPEGTKLPEVGAPRPSWHRWLVLFLGVAAFVTWQYTSHREQPASSLTYTEFYRLVEQDKVASVTLRGPSVTGKLKAEETVNGHPIRVFSTVLPAQEDRDLLPLLRQKSVAVTATSEDQPFILQLLVSLLPLALIAGVWIWLSKRASKMLGSGGGPLGMLKSRPRRFEREGQIEVKFDDVAGLAAAKADLGEVVEFLKYPERFRRLGGKVPRGVLLVGPPGTGKTLLARAVAGEAGVPFFTITGSEFIELFVGVGAARVRELFDEAKKVAPAIIFIDEIDAVGRARGLALGGGQDEREQTLNQLLSEMDGFTRNDLTIVLAATNRPDVLDAALMRPGRFDRRVIVGRPELAARRAILTVHTKDKPLHAGVDLDAVARNTPGFSGADLANLANEAALGATRRGADTIEQEDFVAAFDKIVLGDPRETKLDPDEKHRVAVHESGHAVVAHFSPTAERLERISIIPRGMALGVTQQSPGTDRHLNTEIELHSTLAVLLGGYAAESIVLGCVSSGAANDLQKATELAFKMVANFGMSERVGPVYHDVRAEHPFLGQTMATDNGTSDATIHSIEQETRTFLVEALETAKKTIRDHRDSLDRLAAALVDRESVERAELNTLLGPASSPARGDAALA